MQLTVIISTKLSCNCKKICYPGPLQGSKLIPETYTVFFLNALWFYTFGHMHFPHFVARRILLC